MINTFANKRYQAFRFCQHQFFLVSTILYKNGCFFFPIIRYCINSILHRFKITRSICCNYKIVCEIFYVPGTFDMLR